MVNRIAQKINPNVEYLAINTDSQALRFLSGEVRTLRIGDDRLKGFGTGMNAALAREIAENATTRIQEFSRGADLTFLLTSLGGGTGSGLLPFMADILREPQNITIGIATKPFLFEGGARRACAEETIEKARGKLDLFILISNDRILQSVDRLTNFDAALSLIDDTISEGVRGMVDLIHTPGVVNIDFADLRAIIKGGGLGMLGVGVARGKDRAKEAARFAISSPFLDFSINNARGVIFNVAGGENLAMSEINDAARVITENINRDAAIIFGASNDPDLRSKIKITVVATGLNQENHKQYDMAETAVVPINSRRASGRKKKGRGGTASSPEEDFKIPAFIRKKMQEQ